MNKEGIVLKTHKPFISTIPEHSHMMSIIERTSEAWNWFLNFYIQLRVQDSPASVLNLNFCYGDNVRMIKNCPLFETYCIPRLLFEEGADKIESFMHFSLEHGYYLYFQADRYWLRPSEFYSEDHTAHDIMVVGTEGENVYIQDFFYGEYSQESCPIEDVVMAFEDFGKECPGKGFSEVIIFKPKQGYTYEFDVQMVKDLVNDYSRGQNSTRRFSPTSIPMSRLDMWYSYGTKIYSAFRRHIDYVKESRGLLETRSFHILYSHKEMILELLLYLWQINRITNIDRNVDLIKDIRKLARGLRDLTLKYNSTKEQRVLDRMYEIVDKIELSETALFAFLETDIKDKEILELWRDGEYSAESKCLNVNNDCVSFWAYGARYSIQLRGETLASTDRIWVDGEERNITSFLKEGKVVIDVLANGYHFLEYVGIKNNFEKISCEKIMTNPSVSNIGLLQNKEVLKCGQWYGKYGGLGYDIFTDECCLPPFFKAVYVDFIDRKWRYDDRYDNGQITKNTEGASVVACKCCEKKGIIECVVAGNQHMITFYCMECYGVRRDFKIILLDGDSENKLDEVDVEVEANGVYLSFLLRGHLKFLFESSHNSPIPVSAVFID